MFWLISQLLDRSAPSSPTLRYFDSHDQSLTFLWKENCRFRSMKSLERKKRSRTRRCLESSITTALTAGILLSINTVLFTQTASIPVMEFIALTATGSWLLCLLIGGIAQRFFRGRFFDNEISPLFGRKQDMPRLLAMGIFFSLSAIMFYYAISFLAVMEAVTLYYLYPLFFTILGAVFLRTICGYQTCAGGFICILGGLSVAVPLKNLGDRFDPWESWDESRRIGMASGIGAGAAAALMFLLSGGKWDSRTAREFSHPVALGLWSFQIEAIASAVCLVNQWPSPHIPIPDLERLDWIIVGSFMVCSTVGRLLSCWVIRNKTKSFIIVLEGTHIMWATAGAYLISGEVPPVFAFAGGIFMMVGISIMSMQAQHRDDDMEDWNLDGDPNSECVLQTESTMFTMDINIWS
ncbi:hypothetical protein BSKO_03498 [Bryopsis sp. KO-2023]|nr:hypothetical protein BSKO_03498 [Bryopsis sp. KO-2023]